MKWFCFKEVSTYGLGPQWSGSRLSARLARSTWLHAFALILQRGLGFGGHHSCWMILTKRTSILFTFDFSLFDLIQSITDSRHSSEHPYTCMPWVGMGQKMTNCIYDGGPIEFPKPASISPSFLAHVHVLSVCTFLERNAGNCVPSCFLTLQGILGCNRAATRHSGIRPSCY